MSWDNRVQAAESCVRSIEDRMKRCHEELTLNKNLVDALDAMAQKFGEYMLFEHNADRLYTKAVIETKKLKAEWKALEKEANRKKK